MPISTDTPDSPGWWLDRLLKKLAGSVDRYNLLDTYYRGENGIPVHASKACKDSYKRLMAISRTNFAELVVEPVRERMVPTGFRTGASSDELGDQEAWRIWQANCLDADNSILFRSQLAMSNAATIVGGVDPDIEAPLITIEDPRQVITEPDPRRRRRQLAALKVYRDDVFSEDRILLYLPGVVIRAARAAHPGSETVALETAGFEWDGFDNLPAPVVPVVPFTNRPDAWGRGTGEFEPHLPVLDRINYTILQALETATLQAFRQRAIKGVPTHDQQGNEIDYDDIFSADPGAMWQLPESAEMWESGQVDLGPIRQLNRDNILDLAATTRTPLFYLTPDATNGSAEGASLAREGLVFKTQERINQASESLEQTMSLAFLFAGDQTRARRADMEVIWASPERFSLAERASASAQAAGSLSNRAILSTIWQKTPQEIARIEAERAADLLLTPQPPAAPHVPAEQ